MGFCSSDLSPGLAVAENSRRISHPFGQTFQDGVDSVVQVALTTIALSLWLIVFLGLTCVVYALILMWKENRFGWPLRGVIWFSLAIIGSCVIIGLLAGYVQKTRSLKKISQRVETVTLE
jgi:cell division protein FtsX